MASATDYLEERTVNKAAADQQFSMTAANNLALILSEMLNQMQIDLANQQKGNKPCNKQCNKPGSGKPSLSKLKKMQKKLNQEMKGMMGKKGNKLNNGQLNSPNESNMINWKQNRALIFSRIGQKTWH